MFRRLLAALLSAAFAVSAAAHEAPRLAVIIDDLGDRLPEGQAIVALPAPLTCSFLPQTPYARRLARQAHAGGKEVMLHLPMASVDGQPLGPGGLTLDMTQEAFRRTLLADLGAVPHARGVNNHMGSLLTRHPGHMAWLMAELKATGDLYFVDSRTAVKSVAIASAREYNVPATGRDVFLDNHRSDAYIAQQFATAIALARRHGSAIAIGHAYPETVKALGRLLPQAAAAGVSLVTVSELIDYRNQRRIQQWQASLYPSPKAVKNSKP